MKSVSCSVCLLKSEAVKNLDIPELNMLGSSCVEAAFKKGETIFKQNALSSNIIYLQTGLVKLTMEGPQRTQILRLKKAPCYLGLPTTMGDKINHYSAIALEPSSACFIDIHIFKKLLNVNPEFSYEILMGVCKNELEQFHRCLHLVQSQIYGRLAGTLLYLSEEIYNSDEYDLPLSRNDMADLVCTSRETISRLLNTLSKEGIITVHGKHIRILDRSRLQKIKENG
ncbi:Crp/Fnr family transcriptional regulator [Candidatus Sulfidibacterium hydrothermale]|uniref:Crp/Fnr family transcriptional regulator n=1 Tax=Candidatus Sulfidibacterium hydrothermale TaxID=2875962 RepID=UPI001F0AE66F|nr:Crp/Fnr family transcriptional regulator [Candidatus Sulfidibacterium hydrothermale]UBM61879.1 Crp/Fnr family transcriptional regulator [Candidatus Sulfidibacterium hydrothermale]